MDSSGGESKAYASKENIEKSTGAIYKRVQAQSIEYA